MTCLNNFSNFRYPWGFLDGSGFLSSSAFAFVFDITSPPDRSGYSRAVSYRRRSSGPSENAPRLSRVARCNETIAHRGI